MFAARDQLISVIKTGRFLASHFEVINWGGFIAYPLLLSLRHSKLYTEHVEDRNCLSS